MPADVLARRMQVPGDLPGVVDVELTAEQLGAVERRRGDLLLDAGAGSGKTSVLVERFVRAVIEDDVDVGAILTITFTEKAAAEMRDRIRTRFRELGAAEAARATEGAFISTIHGFCARILRAHAVAAGIDPMFSVLDAPESERLADAALDEVLERLAQEAPGGVDLIAAYGPGALRGAVLSTYSELRSRGDVAPGLPPLAAAPDVASARSELEHAAAVALSELRAIPDPGVRVIQAIERLERCSSLAAVEDPWPGDLDASCLPGGNGAALSTPACAAYAAALERFRAACEHRRAERAHGLLDRLLRAFGARYTERKRAVSGLDFEDLELMTRALLRSDPELRDRYRARFEQIMVDELQDTNAIQLELIELLARENLFTVGDAMQSIYAFRHADVDLFERRAERLAKEGARVTLRTNFRSRTGILEVINRVFEAELGDRFTPLVAGRDDPPSDQPLVELLLADKAAEWASEGLASPWRIAEARALADRVSELIDGGSAPRDVVVLTRATTDIRLYERELEQRGIPTYVIGGRGYWSHPQVVDLVAYLRALANPRDEEALYTLLFSPLVGVSVDALVFLAAAARDSGRDPYWVLVDPDDRLDELVADDRERLARFAAWVAEERIAAARSGLDELIERAIDRTGYDLEVLTMPGGQRRLANLRKLTRLAREYEAASGRDLRGFLDLVRRRTLGWGPDAHESEAPVEGEALDAVRLMTIHRAKGLEFEIVCVADLGRGPRTRAELMRIGRDGRFGLRLAEPGTAKRHAALEYRALGEEQAAADAAEERRLFYVAMTRARERLILSGAAKMDAWSSGAGGGPIAWLGPRVEEAGIEVRVVQPHDLPERLPRVSDAQAADAVELSTPARPPLATAAPPVASLSYTSLAEYERCGYRFYAERVLGLPRTGGAAPPLAKPTAATSLTSPERLIAAERGILVHALLERIDFKRPVPVTPALIAAAAGHAGLSPDLSEEDVKDVAALIEAFSASEVCARLGRATNVRSEQRFGFLLGGMLVEGIFDVLAREAPDNTLVVDYKTDRLEGADPDEVVARAYKTQRLIYALAALRTGADKVEVLHTFLEAPQKPSSTTFTAEDVPALETQLTVLVRGVRERDFGVTDAPHRGICNGCPAEGGLCSWPLEMTRRDAPDRLF